MRSANGMGPNPYIMIHWQPNYGSLLAYGEAHDTLQMGMEKAQRVHGS